MPRRRNAFESRRMLVSYPVLCRLHHAVVFAVVALGAGAAAHAFDRVTLRNGFSYDCAHREPLADGRVRLFLSNGDSSYIDLPASQIESVATLPDPPAPVKTMAPASADVRGLLSAAGEQHDIDVELLASVVHAESDGRANAVSRTGAQGLMQLMPGTARNLGVKDSFQPDQNINGGTAYLDALLTRYHDNLALALAAYNAGPAAVDKYHGIPPYRETRAYVARVMTEFKRRKLQMARQQSVQTASAVAQR
jgi:soluble lytic murein transglycosylase-like protein